LRLKSREPAETEINPSTSDSILESTYYDGEPSLPPLLAELRIELYRPVLYTPDAIDLYNGRRQPEPPLLLVNRQIREEGREIYYRENVFRFYVEDNGADSMVRWMQSCAARGSKPCNILYVIRDTRMWSNLLAWLKVVFEGRTKGSYPTDENSRAWPGSYQDGRFPNHDADEGSKDVLGAN
jgi:hypothetical protein